MIAVLSLVLVDEGVIVLSQQPQALAYFKTTEKSKSLVNGGRAAS